MAVKEFQPVRRWFFELTYATKQITPWECVSILFCTLKVDLFRSLKVDLLRPHLTKKSNGEYELLTKVIRTVYVTYLAIKLQFHFMVLWVVLQI